MGPVLPSRDTMADIEISSRRSVTGLLFSFLFPFSIPFFSFPFIFIFDLYHGYWAQLPVHVFPASDEYNEMWWQVLYKAFWSNNK